jgi:putative PIN family toxin of toxin-antitoxin system
VLRVTADTNIYVSALTTGRGNPYAFLQLARAGKIRLAVSDAILNEVAEVLERKFGWPQEDIAAARDQIEQFAEKVKPAVSLEVVKADPDDNRILECASSAKSDYIVSGDKHLLRLGQHDSIRVLNVADFLRRQAKGQGR